MSRNAEQPVFVLFGPTASGKTELLERLFTGGTPIEAELVSADSMQVYRGMNIGTAKPSPELQKVLPHHLIDIREPNELFNAGDFVRLADEACAGIARRGRLPVVSGGTGFYLKNFIYGPSEAPPPDPALRAALKQELAEKGPAVLAAELARVDPPSAVRIHPNDSYRLLRALEVCRLGRPLSSFAAGGNSPRAGYRFLIVELRRPRAELYCRIELRCREMFRAGLAGEVERLFRRGFTPKDPGLRAIGYREFFVCDQTESPEAWKLSSDIEGVQSLTARNSRRYAKRQMVFFSSIKEAIRLDAETAHNRILDLLIALVHTQQSQTLD